MSERSGNTICDGAAVNSDGAKQGNSKAITNTYNDNDDENGSSNNNNNTNNNINNSNRTISKNSANDNAVDDNVITIIRGNIVTQSAVLYGGHVIV